MLILQFLLFSNHSKVQARGKLALSLIKPVASKSASAERGGRFNALVCAKIIGASISTTPIIAQVTIPRLKRAKNHSKNHKQKNRNTKQKRLYVNSKLLGNSKTH